MSLVQWSAWINILVMLIGSHLVFDFPLQGDYLARTKDHKRLGQPSWVYALLAHSFLQAYGVLLALHFAGFNVVTCLALAGIEFVWHTTLDYGKNDGWLGTGRFAFLTDQALHLLTKVAYCVILYHYLMAGVDI